jgi:hypothetical protein
MALFYTLSNAGELMIPLNAALSVYIYLLAPPIIGDNALSASFLGVLHNEVFCRQIQILKSVQTRTAFR